MKIIECEQGSPEWIAARVGKLGASMVADAVARTKTGWGASRANVMARLVVERLTGQPAESYTNAAMQWGVDTEPDARRMYEFIAGAEVRQVGLVLHPRIAWTHASPDGLVGDAGLVEIKCPTSSTHMETLLGSAIDGRYIKQMQWQMACTERGWCDFVSFDPRFPAEMQLHVSRVERDAAMITTLEDEVAQFLAETAVKVAMLTTRYRQQAS